MLRLGDTDTSERLSPFSDFYRRDLRTEILPEEFLAALSLPFKASCEA